MKFYSIILLAILGYVSWLCYVSISQLEMFAEQCIRVNINQVELAPNNFRFKYSEFEQELLNNGLVDIQRLNPNIKVDLVYASDSNLTGEALYSNFKRGFLQPFIAKKMAVAQENLEKIDSTLSILVLDAARPQSVQFKLWEWAKAKNMQKYVAAPWAGSNHNFGCAVDVTIIGKDSLLDMGTKYDHFGPAAEPRYQWKLVEEGKLSQEQIDNRLLLKEVMKSAGFRPIQTEWWHFNGLSKEKARAYYKLIK